MPSKDVEKLAAAIQRDFAETPDPLPYIPTTTASRIIDCVLSLRKPYKSVVIPRVQKFEREHPEVRTAGELVDLIATAGGGSAFIRKQLAMNSSTKGRIIEELAARLHELQASEFGDSEESRLRAWAERVDFWDYKYVGVKGFALAGFQYLRMLFGADTAKPDQWIVQYVSEAIGHLAEPLEALQKLQQAAGLAGVSVRKVDGMIWEKLAKYLDGPKPH